MASITIRNLDDGVKTQLCMRAVEHETGPKNLASTICAHFAPFGGVELEIPLREPIREPPRFE